MGAAGRWALVARNKVLLQNSHRGFSGQEANMDSMPPSKRGDLMATKWTSYAHDGKVSTYETINTRLDVKSLEGLSESQLSRSTF
jgi:hypothetical protein